MIKYVNSENREIVIDDIDIKPSKGTSFHQYVWTPNGTARQYGMKVKNFKKEALQLPVELLFMSGNIRDNLNKFFEYSDYDVSTEKPGRLYWEEYYIECFVIQSNTTPSEAMLDTGVVSCILFCPYPFWLKETTTTFNTDSSGIIGGKNLDYPHDYDFNFASNLNAISIDNEGYLDADFKIVIYGPALNPAININGHKYSVDVEINEGEYLTIDSIEKKIFLTQNKGNIINYFNKRNRESYIFEKVPVGTSVVSWNNDFKFDITVIEKRSQPKWKI